MNKTILKNQLAILKVMEWNEESDTILNLIRERIEETLKKLNK